MSREAVILVTLVVYQVILLGIAVMAHGRNRSGRDFFLAGKKLGPVVASVSASASSSSAWTLMGVSGAAYADGVSALWLFPACVGGFLLNWCVLAPALQRFSHGNDAITVTDVLAGTGESRSRGVAWLASLIVLISLSAYVASQYQAAGKTFSETFDLSLEGSIIIGAGVVLLYTLHGGFWAVSLTDTLQGLVMAATAVILPVAALIEVGGLAAIDWSGGEPRPVSIAVGATLGLLGIGLGYPGQPHVVNRFMALENSANAMKQARRVAVGWAVIVYAGMLLLGLCGRALMPSLGDNESIFIAATLKLFPPAVAGMMLAAVLSAVMSTADSQLLVASSAVTHDMGLGGSTSRRMLVRSRITVAVLGSAACVAAIYLEKRIFSNVLFGWYAMGAAFGPLLLTMIVGQRTLTRRNVFIVMATGFATSVTGFWGWPGVLEGPAYKFLRAGLVSFGIAFGLAMLLSKRRA